MHTLERVELTNICLISDDTGHVLVERRDGRKWPGISLPGGHVESGESIVDSVVREVYEETGLRVSQLQLCGIVDWINEDGSRYIVYMYRAGAFSGELRASDEGDVWWVPRDELPRLKLSPGMLDMLKVYDEPELSELWYRVEGDKWNVEIK